MNDVRPTYLVSGLGKVYHQNIIKWSFYSCCNDQRGNCVETDSTNFQWGGICIVFCSGYSTGFEMWGSWYVLLQ